MTRDAHLPALRGLDACTVGVVPYEAAWPAMYAAERDRIAALRVTHGVSLVLDHTGSTAVPRRAAKPVLDLLAGGDGYDVCGAAIAAIVAAGDAYRGEKGIPGRDFFRRG
ncbi:MAG: hypothetical protein NVS1B4_07190 [Gemmatimonadaceae bacterium]